MQDDFQGRDLFAGPIHGVLCSSRVTFSGAFHNTVTSFSWS